MAIKLKQSTASQEIPLGYFVDSADGNTEETALTIANTDIKLWKNGATTLASKNSGGATHISNGIYYAVLDATDTDTLGPLIVFVHVTGALPVRVECEVLAANVYDSLVGATDRLDVQVAGMDNSVIATSTFTGNAINGSVLAPDCITSTQLNASAVNEIADQVWDELMAGHVGAGSAGSWLITIPQTSDIQNAVWDVSMGSHSGAGTSGGYLATINANTAASAIRSALGLAAANLDTQFSNIAANVWDRLTSALTTVGSIGKLLVDNINATISSRASQTSVDTLDDYVDTEVAAIKAKTDLIPASPASTGDIPSAATIADAVWDEALVSHNTSGSTGAYMLNDYQYSQNAAGDTAFLVSVTPASGFRVKKNTALNNFEFLMRQSGDHITPATGLTVTAERSIDGAAFAACANAVSEVGSGVYKINLAAADLNGNVITLKFTATGADQRTVTVVTQG